MTFIRTSSRVSLILLLVSACPGDDGMAEGSGSSTGPGTTGSSVTLSTTGEPMTTGATSAASGSTSGADSTGTVGLDTGTTTALETTSGSDSGSGSGSGSGSESSGESSGSSSGGMVDPCDGMEALLYEQAPDMAAGIGAPAGIGVGGFIRSADDFVIDPADQCWCVTRVVLSGAFIDSNLSGDLELSLHDDDLGVPLNPPTTVESGVPMDMAGTLDYTLASPVILPAGSHWLAALPQLPDINDGIWFWLPSMVVAGSEWAMESDFPPFIPACQNWAPGNPCFDITATDLAFEIHGVVGGAACP